MKSKEVSQIVRVWDVSFLMGNQRSKTGFSWLFFITTRMLANIILFGRVLVLGSTSVKKISLSSITQRTSELLFKTDRKENITITSFFMIYNIICGLHKICYDKKRHKKTALKVQFFIFKNIPRKNRT